MSYKIHHAHPDDVWLVGAKGIWRGAVRDGKRSATLSCPGCGKCASLSDHEIAADGVVNPSVVCPHGCGFHEHVQLEDWTSEPKS